MKTFKRYVIIALVFTIFGFCIPIYLNYLSKKNANILVSDNFLELEMPNTKNILQKIKINDVLVSEITTKKELITLEANLSQDVYWDESFTDFEIFKKIQRMTFYGKGKFSTDLSDFNSDDIHYDDNNNILKLYINKPEISSIDIDFTKTKIYSTNNGLLRFGEIKLKSTDQNAINLNAKNQMLNALKSKTYLELANERTKLSIAELIKTILVGNNMNDIQIDVVYKS